MSSNLTPFNSDGGFNTTGNITGGNIATSGTGGDITLTGGNIAGANNVSAAGAANVNSMNISQSIRWDYSGSQIYEDGGLVINGPGGVFAQGNVSARFEFNDGLGNSGGLYSDIGNSLVYSVGNVIVRSNNLSQIDWTFGTDGNLSIPGSIYGPADSFFNIAVTDSGPGASLQLGDWDIAGFPKSLVQVSDNVHIVTGVTTGGGDWNFDTNGDVTVPGDILAQEGNDLAVRKMI